MAFSALAGIAAGTALIHGRHGQAAIAGITFAGSSIATLYTLVASHPDFSTILKAASPAIIMVGFAGALKKAAHII